MTAVRFANNVAAQFTVNSATQITATVPSGAVTGVITISKTGCTEVQTVPFTITTAGPCIDVVIASNLTAGTGTTLTVPITVSDTTGKAAIAYDATLTYDPAVLRLQNPPTDKTGTLSSNFTITTNGPAAGQLLISGFGSTALTGAGVLLNVKFDVLGAANACSNLSFTTFRFNEGTPCSATTFGQGLATRTEAAATVPLPTGLAGTTVRVRDSAGIERLAPLFFVSSGQVNYQVPPGTAAGAATLIVTSGDGAVSTGTLQVARVMPGLFAANANGMGAAAAVALRIKTDGSQIYELVATYDAAQQRYVPLPLSLGPEGEQLYLILFGTGARNLSSLANVHARVGGTEVPVAFVGAVEGLVGLDQLNVGPLSRSLAGRGEVSIVIQVDGQTANVVTVSVR